jgi:hypothetical protein
MIGAGLALNAVADVIYLVQVADDTYVEGTFLDVLWPAAILVVAMAAWQPSAEAPARREERRAVLMPTLAVGVAIALMTYDHFDRINTVTLILTAVTLAAATARMAFTFAEHQGLLAFSREEALTDALTGLHNRRSLMIDLETEVSAATPIQPRAVLLFDLDGFKQYNDAFGHLAGDAPLPARKPAGRGDGALRARLPARGGRVLRPRPAPRHRARATCHPSRGGAARDRRRIRGHGVLGQLPGAVRGRCAE